MRYRSPKERALRGMGQFRFRSLNDVPKFNTGPVMATRIESEKKTYFLHHRSKRKITLPHVTIQDDEI